MKQQKKQGAVSIQKSDELILTCMQYVAVCCGVLRCVALCRSVLHLHKNRKMKRQKDVIGIQKSDELTLTCAHA